MTDHFAALAQPRRPWLDGDALKESFHRAATLDPWVVTNGALDAQFQPNHLAAQGSGLQPRRRRQWA